MKNWEPLVSLPAFAMPSIVRERRRSSQWFKECRTQKSFAGVPKLEVLIREFLAVDRLSTGTYKSNTVSTFAVTNWYGYAEHTVTTGEVTALDHEALDDTVEGRALITEALLTGSESAALRLVGVAETFSIDWTTVPEVLSCLYPGRPISVQSRS